MNEIEIAAAQAAARNIIETALKALTDMGMEYENAASLLCIQGFIRVEDPKKIETLKGVVNDTLVDYGDVPPPPGEDDGERTH